MNRLASLLLTAALTACGGTRPAGAPPISVHDAEPLLLEPSAPGAERYPDPFTPDPVSTVAPADDPLAGRIAREAVGAARALGRPRPRLDARLSAAAAALASVSRGGETPPPPAVQFAASHFGVVEPISFLIVVEARGATDESVARSLEASLTDALRRKPLNRLGVGVRHGAEGLRTVVVAMAESHLGLTPVPRVAGKDGFPLVGRLLPPFEAPTVFIADPDGRVREVPPLVNGDRFEADFRCAAMPGEHRVEVMGNGPQGPVVLANFPVWCGAVPPAALQLARTAAGPTDAREAEQLLFERINTARAEHGLPPLRWDEQAAAVARAHSRDMAAHHFVAHVSPRTGDTGERLRAAGIDAPLMLENVGVAPTAEQLHEGFMNSPGHRQAILSPRVQRVGTGVAREGGQMYGTEVFLAAAPSATDARGALEKLRQALQARREAAGRQPLERSERLDAIAGDVARRMAAGDIEPQDAAREALTHLEQEIVRYRGLRALVGVGPNPHTLAESAAVGDPAVVGYGAAVAVGNNAEGARTFHTLVLLGTQ